MAIVFKLYSHSLSFLTFFNLKSLDTIRKLNVKLTMKIRHLFKFYLNSVKHGEY